MSRVRVIQDATVSTVDASQLLIQSRIRRSQAPSSIPASAAARICACCALGMNPGGGTCTGPAGTVAAGACGRVMAAEAIGQLPFADSINAVMGIEGHAARRYVAAWRHLLSTHADIVAPAARSSRPATDPLNAALSFGYGLLRVAVHGALEQVGLDPYIGFLHGIRPGKPALALDLMEEFRAELVDRVVFTAFNQRKLAARHFQKLPGGAHELTDDGRRAFLSLWSDARTQTRRHHLLGTQVPSALLTLVQARILARYLRGDISQYVSWGPA